MRGISAGKIILAVVGVGAGLFIAKTVALVVKNTSAAASRSKPRAPHSYKKFFTTSFSRWLSSLRSTG
jgi:hypothetical protein